VIKILKKGKILFSLMLLASLVAGILVPAGAAMADPPPGYDVALTTPQHAIPVTSGETFDIPVTIDSASNPVAGYQVGFDWTGSEVVCTGATYGAYMTGALEQPGTPAAGTTGLWAKFASSEAQRGTGSGLAITFHFQAVADGMVTLSYSNESFVSDPNVLPYDVYTDGDINVSIGLPDLGIIDAAVNWVTPGTTYNISFTIKNFGAPMDNDNAGDVEVSVDSVLVENLHFEDTPYMLGTGESFTATTGDITLTDGIDTVSLHLIPGNQDGSTANDDAIVTASLITMSVVAPASVQVGASFDVNINIGTGSTQTRGAQAAVTFDPAVLECTGVSEGSFYSTWAAANGATNGFIPGVIDNESGTMVPSGVLVYGGTGGPSGSGTILIIHFKAIGVSAGSAISLDNCIISDVTGTSLPGLSLEDDTVVVTAVSAYDFTIGPAQVQVSVEGDEPVFYVIYRVNNVGDKATGASHVGVLVNGSLKEAQEIGALAAGGYEEHISGPWPIPVAPTVTVKLVADYYNNNNKEANENNNTWEQTLSNLPDYIVAEKYEIETAPGIYTITYTIKNIGLGDASVASTTVVKVDGVVVDSQDCPALLAGQSGPTVIITDVNMSSANDVVLVIADADGDIVESNENNNERTNTYSPNNVDNDTEIIGSVVPQIEIICPSDIIDFQLNLGENTISGVLNVKSNGTWQVEVSDENGVTHGHMTQWTGTAYGIAQLTDPMIVACFSEGKQITLPDPGLLATGDTSTQFLDEGENFDIDFIQIVYFSDPVQVYRIVVTFTAGVTF
jgi:hypothetical protein